MFIMHVALQGCLRGAQVEYGVSADTGGHIRYLLDLVRASTRNPSIRRLQIVTRAFHDPHFARCYAEPSETIDASTSIVRLATTSLDYLPKESLWTEHEAFVAALIAHIERLDAPPDLLHAHYADAGRVAAAIQRRLGIPFLFTAHSLGRVKRDRMPPGCPETLGIDRRIAIEEEAIAAASGIVASSRDEAELQFAGYDSYEPGRIRIIPPGSDLSAFGADADATTATTEIARHLRHPDKPVLLAIARPVTRKNLSALLHAYGQSPALQSAANLVILAGTRDTLDTLEPEIARNLTELLLLVDRYDLHGLVALPKHHRPEDVPGYYAYAARRRGIFVNPALNEPFGLTLLEAAASGLPVVATDSGGPNDIVEGGGNGILVDPHRPDAIAAALLRILADDALWDRYAAAGALAVRGYDWDRHVALYAAFARAVSRPVAPQPPASQDGRLLLVSDIDNTLIGCRESTRSFTAWHADQGDLLFGIATGRSFHSALSILAQSDVERPQVVISSVGSEIYHLVANGAVYERDAAWTAQIAAGWDRDAVEALMRTRSRLPKQGRLEQRAFKLSYFTGGDPHAGSRVRDLLAAHGQPCSVIQSHGRYLDILPLAASKGTAVEHVRQLYGLGRDSVMVAGDSGNDVEMLRSVPHAIIVANYSDDLATRPELAHSYVARRRYARGVMEGVDHFRALRAAR